MSERPYSVRACLVSALLLALLLGVAVAHVHDHDSGQLCRHCEDRRALDLPGRIGLDLELNSWDRDVHLAVPVLARKSSALGALTFRGPPAPSP